MTFAAMAKRSLHSVLGVTALCASRIVVAECKEDNPLQKLLRKFKRPKPPKPQVVDNFLSPDEAAYLLDRYELLMKESRSLGYVKNKAAGTSKYRTSRSVRLPPLGDPITFDIERRAAQLSGFNHSYVEDIQMACYEEDELHGLHRDDADAAVNADRAATVLVYLEAPEGGGGETLFTMRELEDERDMRTGNTEDGALKLFRSYCDRPKKHHVVVEPVVGRAVTWQNWLGDEYETFARSSTHGACPVKKGKKCVIQQWIGRKNKLPLRDERMAAIFTAGADLNYQKAGVGEDDADLPCLSDASAMEGSIVSALCAENDNVNMIQLDNGPYSGIGALQIINGGLKAYLPSDLIQNGITISFWARDLSVGSTVVALEDQLSLVYIDKGDFKQTFELRANGGKSEELKVYGSGSKEQWYWISISYEQGKMAAVSIFSRGQLDGSISVELDSCGNGEMESSTSTSTALQIFPSAGEDGGKNATMDVAFVVIHQEMLDDEAYILQLGQQAQRYDKNS